MLELSHRFDRAVFHSKDFDLPYRLLHPVAAEKTKRPLILFFHGAGERGHDNERSLTHILPFLLRGDVPVEKLYVLVPQCSRDDRWVETDWSLPSHHQPLQPSRPMAAVLTLLDRLVKTERVDSSRIYVMGLSMGGFAVWDVLARTPGRFAAGVAICGGADEITARRLRRIPIRVYHGSLDRVVQPERSRHMVEALRKLGGNIQYREYANTGHGSWVPAFRDPDLALWLFAQKRVDIGPAR